MVAKTIGGDQRHPITCPGTPATRLMKSVVPEKGDTIVLTPHAPTSARAIIQSSRPRADGGKTALTDITTMMGCNPAALATRNVTISRDPDST